MTDYVSRINQLDAAQLDSEIHNLLRERAEDAVSTYSLGKLDSWQPEVNALLRVLIWSNSLRSGDATFGQRMLNLHYKNLSKSLAALYLFLDVLPRYLFERLADERTIATGEFRRSLRSIAERLGHLFNVMQLLNALSFLYRGVQPRLTERLLNITSRPLTQQGSRMIGYSYMTRELLWHGLIELFTVSLPMLNVHYLKQSLLKLRARPKSTTSLPKLELSSKCAVCREPPILPSHAGCADVYCYYCLKGHFSAAGSFVCPLCRVKLDEKDFQRLRVDQ